MAALFESSTSGGLFFDTGASAGPYSSDLDFDYLLSQVGSFDSPSSDDSFLSSSLLEGKPFPSASGELTWHVELFDSAHDIVDEITHTALAPCAESQDKVRHTAAPATNSESVGPTNIKQNTSRTKGQKSRLPSSSDTYKPDIPLSSSTAELFSLDLSHEELHMLSEAFVNSNVEHTPATISPSLLVAPLTPPPSSPLSLEPSALTVTTPVQNKKDPAAMDYPFLNINQAPSELYVPDYGYPLTPGGYMDPNNYVVDMAKSRSAPGFPLDSPNPNKRRRRVPEPLHISPQHSNKRKRDDDDLPRLEMKRPKLQPAQYSPTQAMHPVTTPTVETVQTPITDQSSYPFHSDMSPYENLMQCYTDPNFLPESYVMAQTQYITMSYPSQTEGFHTPPVSPFETMGWYAPQRPTMQKTQPTYWNTPRSMPYPISPAPTPKKALAPRQLPLTPPTLPRSTLPLPPKKKGRKGKNAGMGEGMFINFTADDKDTILNGVAPSGSSKGKKEKKGTATNTTTPSS